jgi:radical SAM protein with 4Fe4S-binding SPASM domain
LIQDTGRWQGNMNFDLFRKIIDDLAGFDRPIKVLRLYKEGEPFLNPCFADMVRYAKQSGCVEAVDTTTNGSLLTPERVGPALEAGLDRINISVDGLSDAQFLEFARVKVDFRGFVNNIRQLFEMKGDCEICIKTAGDFLSEADKEMFYRTFGDYADRIFIENVAPCWPEFDVQDRLGISIAKCIYDQPVENIKTCPYIFYSLTVNSDGTVSLCFLDWARKLMVGDVRQQSLKDIWNGNALHLHRREHLRGNRGNQPVCHACGQLSHGAADNIDPYAAQLLTRLEKQRP